jgi:hypothetical protein
VYVEIERSLPFEARQPQVADLRGHLLVQQNIRAREVAMDQRGHAATEELIQFSSSKRNARRREEARREGERGQGTWHAVHKANGRTKMGRMATQKVEKICCPSRQVTCARKRVPCLCPC